MWLVVRRGFSHSLALLTAGLSLCSLSCHAISVPKREPVLALLCDAHAPDPCKITRELASYYNVTLDAPFTSGRLPEESASPSLCSTVLYSIVSACTTCRGTSHMSRWSQWSAGCSNVYVGHLPEPTPTDVQIPAWAYIDVTQKDLFDLINAQALGRNLRVNPRQDNFSYPYPTPSFTSSPSFLNPYPIPTSFSVTSYSYSFSPPSYSFSAPSYSFSPPSYSWTAPSYSFSAPSYSIPSYTFSFSTPTYNFPTAAPGYSVPSIPTGLSSPEEHGGGGEVFSSKRKVNIKAIIGGVVGAVSSVAAIIGGVWAWMKRRAKRALGLSQGDDDAHAVEQQKPFVANNPATNLPHVPYAHPAPPVLPPEPYVPTVY